MLSGPGGCLHWAGLCHSWETLSSGKPPSFREFLAKLPNLFLAGRHYLYYPAQEINLPSNVERGTIPRFQGCNSLAKTIWDKSCFKTCRNSMGKLSFNSISAKQHFLPFLLLSGLPFLLQRCGYPEEKYVIWKLKVIWGCEKISIIQSYLINLIAFIKLLWGNFHVSCWERFKTFYKDLFLGALVLKLNVQRALRRRSPQQLKAKGSVVGDPPRE